MARAEITWNGPARSHRIRKHVFQLNKTEIKDEPWLIDYVRTVRGFSVQLLPEAEAKVADSEGGSVEHVKMPRGRPPRG